ncbi:S-adenosylmethionine decarboxylase [Neoconidiobolus thromboides FSU 785]|nr:S-adenosylmethionine decarboxylase [Neoconidiobolus thromboides FSU 785]
MLKEDCIPIETYDFHGFEGPEKLLEIWFLPQAKEGDEGLKKVGLEDWIAMLKLVNCEILNIVQNEQVDSYLLSESSMFIYNHKIVLKTCGTTTLLHSIPKILELAQNCLNVEQIYRVFYSRKSFMFPEKQLYPHSDWDSEVNYLDKYFENGAPYKIGRTNGEHWYLYVNSNSRINSDKNNVTETAILPINETNELTHDFTIELLMTDLDEEHSKVFYIENNNSTGRQGGEEVADKIGLSKIYTNLIQDPFLFEPCGFSMNALANEHYFNVHVTPETHCSYASFETNIPLKGDHDSEVKKLVEKVLKCFKPKQFSITLFKEGNAQLLNLPVVDGFKKKDSILYDIDGYSLRYGHFKRE